MHIQPINVPQALPMGLAAILNNGTERDSRNGPVLAMDEPFIISYQKPSERVLFLPEREANPFFHLYEFLWMMAGRRDVIPVANYVAGMRNYSDDGKSFNAAYGHRWIKHFGFDQIAYTIDRLKAEGGAEDRRNYTGMWDPRADTKPTLDMPCNVGIAWRVRSDGRLDMTVFNRSNDFIWGALGANAVHMSMLHEFVALCSGFPIGTYHQVSNDMHIYKAKLEPWCEKLATGELDPADYYAIDLAKSYPILETSYEQWTTDLDLFMKYGLVVGITDRFFRRVAGPVVMAHKHFRSHKGVERYYGALEILEQCLASDWRIACIDWIQRRLDRFLEKAS